MASVLLVDDQDNVLHLLHLVCEQAGIDHACVASGTEALDYLDSHPVRVLVTDLTMPGIDGLELFARARQRRPLLRGIVFSGHITYEVLLQILELGFDEALMKPLKSFETLTCAIQDSLDLYEHWRLRVAQLRGFSQKTIPAQTQP